MAAPSLPTEPTDDGATLRCARHSGIETVLRCGRCETPICPRCMVSTPVGARCPSCAQVKGRPASLLKRGRLARALGYGVAAAAAGTLLLVFVPFLGLIGYAILGFVVGEAVSVGANRVRVRELGPLALASLALGFELGIVGSILLAGAKPGAALLLQPLLVLTVDRMVLIGLLLGGLLAWMRVR